MCAATGIPGPAAQPALGCAVEGTSHYTTDLVAREIGEVEARIMKKTDR